MVFAWYCVSVVAGFIPMVCIKLHTEENNLLLIFVAMLSYLLLIYTYTIILRNDNFSLRNTIKKYYYKVKSLL